MDVLVICERLDAPAKVAGAVVRDDDDVQRHRANVAPAAARFRRPFGESALVRTAAFLLVLTAAAGVAVRSSGEAHAASATRYVAPGGNDALGGKTNVCRSKATPCRTFNRAYQAARPGDTVVLGGGTYPGQTIRVSRGKVRATRNVVFRPAAGANVRVGGTLRMYGSHATFLGSKKPYNFHVHGLESEATEGANASNHVTYANLDGAWFTIDAASYITIRGGDWGPADGAKGDEENKIGPDGNIGPLQQPSHILLDRVLIHDQQSSDLTAHHHGGLMMIGGDHITIRNSKFLRNVVYNIEVDDFVNWGHPHDVILQNNWFGAPVTGLNDQSGAPVNDGQAEVQLKPNGNGYRNWLVRYNSFHNGFAPNFGGSASSYKNFRVLANTGDTQNCQAGVMYRYNAWTDSPLCHSSERTIGKLPYVDARVGHENYHLRRGTKAQNFVPRSAVKPGSGLMLRRDIDGRRRPCGTRWDAGSDERC